VDIDIRPIATPPSIDMNEDSPRASHLRVPARLIEYARQRYVALPPHATIELLDNPSLVHVPGADYYLRGLLKWQGRWLPVIDLHTLLRAYANYVPVPLPHVLVVAYQVATSRKLHYGALALPALPQMINVGDDSECALPTDSDLWPLIATSCFRRGDGAVPVVDCRRIFDVYYG
jgi:chemotaxis signal transduction protein